MHILSVLNFRAWETIIKFIRWVGTKSLECFSYFYVLVIVKDAESCRHSPCVRVVEKSENFWPNCILAEVST